MQDLIKWRASMDITIKIKANDMSRRDGWCPLKFGGRILIALLSSISILWNSDG